MLLFLAFMLIVSFGFGIIVVIAEFAGFDLGGMYAGAALYVVLFLVPGLGYLLLTRQKHRDVLKWRPIELRAALVVIAIAISLIPLASLISLLGSFVFAPIIDDYLIDLTSYPFWFMMLSVAVLPAFLEEFIIRGALYKEFERLPIKKIAIITGLFFGIMHLNFHQFFYAAVLGIIYAYILYYTQSIWAPILMHFVNNGIAVALAYFLPDMAELGYGHEEPTMLMTIAVFGVLSLLGLAVTLICLKYLKANAAPPPVFEDEGDEDQPKVFTWAFWMVVVLFLMVAALIEVGARLGDGVL